MKAARYMTKAITGKATGRLFWRWPLAFGLALAVAISLFHDLPAFAGTGDASSTPLAVARAHLSKRLSRSLPDTDVIVSAILQLRLLRAR
jgi:hypothetical protein